MTDQCQFETQEGKQCKRSSEEGREYCWQHPLGNACNTPDDEQIIRALRENDGMVYLAAEAMGVSHKVIYRRAETNEEIADILEREQGKIDDMAESKLKKAIEEEEPWAVQFRLGQGPRRKFKDRKDHTSSDGSMSGSESVIFLPSNGRQEDVDESD